MDEEILEYLRSQFGDDYFDLEDQGQLQEYENNILRGGLSQGFDLVQLRSAMGEIRNELIQKKKDEEASAIAARGRGYTDADGNFQPLDFSNSNSEDSPYAGGLGFNYSGQYSPGVIDEEATSNAQQQWFDDWNSKYRANPLELQRSNPLLFEQLTADNPLPETIYAEDREAEAFAENQRMDELGVYESVEDISAKQLVDLYQYYGYSEEASQKAAGSIIKDAREKGMTINAYTDNLFIQGFDRDRVAQFGDNMTIENRERFYTSPMSFQAAKQEGLFVANWLDKGLTEDEMYSAAEELGVKLHSHNAFHEDFLTPGEDYFSFWLIDEENAPGDETGVGKDLVRFYNRAIISRMQSDMLDPISSFLHEIDYERLAYYQKLMRDNQQVGWDTDNAFLTGLDTVISSVISPIFESAVALTTGVFADAYNLSFIAGVGAVTEGAGISTAIKMLYGKEGLALEYSSKVLEVFQELGYDTTNPQELAKAFENPEAMSEARTRGLAKGIPIAIVDMMSYGTASAIYKRLMKGGASFLKSAAYRELTEATMGAAGEALGQVVETGEIYDVKGIALEFIGQTVQTAPMKAFNAVKGKEMSAAEKQYMRFAILNNDSHELTTVASAMNYNEVRSIDQRIKEERQAARKAKSKEARATHRQNVRTLQNQKYETLNRNIETLQNLSVADRKAVGEKTRQMNDMMVELKRFKKSDPGRKAVIREIGKLYGDIQNIINPQEARPGTVQAEIIPGVESSVEPAPGAPIVQEEPTPTIEQLNGEQTVVKLPTGQIARGLLTIDEGGKVSVTEADGGVVELGNISELEGQTIEEAGFGSFVSNLNEDGSFTIRGKEYTAPRGKRSINLNEDGEVVSVTLKDSKGRNRTFRGEVAQEIAYYFSQPQTNNKDTRSLNDVIGDFIEAEMGGPVEETETSTEPTTEETEEGDQVVIPSEETPPLPEEPVEEAPSEPEAPAPKPALTSGINTITPRGGVSERVAQTVNNLVKALRENIGSDVRIVIWNNTEDLNRANNTQGYDAYYNFNNNTINITVDSSDAVIREEFAHAGLGGIMSDDKVRTRLYQEVLDLVKKNPALAPDMDAFISAYQAEGKRLGMTPEGIEAMVQEEAVIRVLTSYSENMNQIDSSIKAKIRRIINRALSAIGFKDLTITDDTSLDRLAETFAFASRQGRAIKQDVSTPFRTKPVPDGGRANINMLTKALGLNAKTIKQVAGARQEAFIVQAESFMNRPVIEPTEGDIASMDIDDPSTFTPAFMTEVFDLASQSLDGAKDYMLEFYLDFYQYKNDIDVSTKGLLVKPRNVRVPIVAGNFFLPETREQFEEQFGFGFEARDKKMTALDPGSRLRPRLFKLSPLPGEKTKLAINGQPYDMSMLYPEVSELMEDMYNMIAAGPMQQAMLSMSAVKINEKDFGTMEDNPEFYRDEVERVMGKLAFDPSKNFYANIYGNAKKLHDYVLGSAFDNTPPSERIEIEEKAKETAKAYIDVTIADMDGFINNMFNRVYAEGREFTDTRLAFKAGFNDMFEKNYSVFDMIDVEGFGVFTRGMKNMLIELVDLGAPSTDISSYSLAFEAGTTNDFPNPVLQQIRPINTPNYERMKRFHEDMVGEGKLEETRQKEYSFYTSKMGDVSWYLTSPDQVPGTMDQLVNDADNISDPYKRLEYLSWMENHTIMMEDGDYTKAYTLGFQQKVKDKVDKARNEILGGRAALNAESIKALKEGIVAAQRVGQGIAVSKGKSTDIMDMTAATVRSLAAPNKNKKPIYVEHAIALTSTERHPLMVDQEVPPFIDNMPKEDYSREGMVTLYHGGFGLEEISNDRPLYISPEESEAADYQRLQDAEEKSNPKLVNPVYVLESKVASQDQALEIARQLFPSKMAQYDATGDAMFFMLIDIEGMEARNFSLEDIPFILNPRERKKYFAALESAGFDAVSFVDQQADQTKSPRTVENMVVLNPKSAIDNGSMKLQSQKEWADGIYATFKERVVSNLLYLHDLADPEIREYMRRWYDGANKIAKDMSGKYDISVEQSAGILAALSPGADWFINIQNAYNIVEVLYNQQNSTFDDVMYNTAIERKLESYRQTGVNSSTYKKKAKGKKMTASKLLKKDRDSFNSFKESMDNLRGRTLSSMDALEKAKFVRYFREVYMPSTIQAYNPVGDDLGIYTTKDGNARKVVTQSFSNMAKAITMFENNDVAMISELLGGSHKIRHFYNNIANPDATDGDVTMDTHAVAAAELMPYGQKSAAVNENFGSGIMNQKVNGLSGNYWAYLDAYTEAANQRGILPREMQSITWEVIRLLMPSTLRDESSRSDIAQIYKDYQGEAIEDVQNEIKKYFDEKDTDTETPRGTNIKHPFWHRPSSSEGNTTQGETTNEGDLAGGDLPSGTSTPGSTPGNTSNDTGRANLKMRQATRKFVDMLKTGTPQEIAFSETILKAKRRAAKGTLRSKDEGADFFYKPQSINASREQLMGMTTAEIVSLLDTDILRMISDDSRGTDFSTDGNILVLAQVEYLERLRKQGNMNAYKVELAKLTKMGTTFGQLLRQFGEIKGKTVDGMVSIIANEYEQKGTPLKDESLQELTQIVDEYMSAKNEYDKVVSEVLETDPNNFDTLDKKVQEAQDRLEKAIGGINEFQKFNAPSWGTLLSTIMQGNLLTLRSITTNVIANAFTLPLRLGEQLIAAPINFMLDPKGREIRPSFGAMIYGAQRSWYGLKEAYKSIKTGKAPGDFEYTAGYQLRPLVALATVFGRGKENLPQEFHGQLDFMNYKTKKLFEGIFGLTAAGNFKLLVLGDRPFYRGMEGYELYQQGKKLGLEGESLKQFLKYPTEEHMNIARQKGLKLTFQENDSTVLLGLLTTEKVQSWFNKAGSIGAASDSALTRVFGNAMKFMVKSNFPFVKTPFNILSQSLELTLFPLTFAQAFVPGMKARDRSEKLATALMGYMLFLFARRLYDQGVASGAVDELSPKARSVAYEVEPPFTINVSAMGREQGEPFLPSDRRVGFSKLGLPGAVMAAYIKAFQVIDRDQNFSKEEELKVYGLEEQDAVSTFLERSFGITLGTLGALMDQSFLTGMENLTKMLQNTEDMDVVSKYFEQLSRAMVSVPLPNIYTSFFRAEREFLLDYRDEGFTNRFKNVIYDRTFGAFGRGDNPAPARINVWGEKINQTPPGTDPVFYEFLDPTGTRLATDDPLKVELYSLYRRTGDENALPSIPSLILNKEYKINRGSEKVEFTTNEVNEMLMLLGQQRTAQLRTVVGAASWDRLTDEAKINIVKKINNRYSKGYMTREDGTRQIFDWYRMRQEIINNRESVKVLRLE